MKRQERKRSKIQDHENHEKLESPFHQSSDTFTTWSETASSVAKRFQTNPDKGLTASEVRKRFSQYGPNQLREHIPKSVFKIFWDQLKNIITGLLAIASLLSFVYGKSIEGFAIIAVLLLNTFIGFFTELHAVQSMEALFKLGKVMTRVRRDGETSQISAEEIVPGDIVVIEGGDIITADLRIWESSKLQVDESALTGESIPVNKNADPVADDTLLADRTCMLYKGTSITRGSGAGIAVATGMQTELGNITSLIRETDEEETPLEKRLDLLGHKLIWITLLITVFVSVMGILGGKDIFLMVETGIALSVATIPEGLPIVATIALARGLRIMAKKNALINRLSSVETLGATTVIFTDKTGTLTENRLTVKQISMSSGTISLSFDPQSPGFYKGEELLDVSTSTLTEALEIGVLCNNANLLKRQKAGATGDPLEIALLMAGDLANLHREDLLKEMPERKEISFDPDIKMMATFHSKGKKIRTVVKGAPESVLALSNDILTENGVQPINQDFRKQWKGKNNQMAQNGLRVIAVAEKYVDSIEENPYSKLTFVGLIGLYDPPRQDIRESIGLCRTAGINVIMTTGDQPITAISIAKAVGLIENENHNVRILTGSQLREISNPTDQEKQLLLDTQIFARVSPEQKLNLIHFFKENRNVVAMTGDGVNDAPALKKADIGIAMGKQGTQVAREASDMILLDDAFSTLVIAIEQGRVIFNNIRKFVFYLLSCNVSEVMVVGLASMVNITLPILPLQILFLNLVTDVFPALALGVNSGDKSIMQQPPRNPEESILNRSHWLGIIFYGVIITLVVLGSLFLALRWLHLPVNQAVTISFLTLAFSQLWHVFNMRSRNSRITSNEITKNPFIWLALAICIGLLLAAIYVQPIASVLGTIHPGIMGWLIVLVLSVIPLFLGQIVKGSPLNSVSNKN